jgi:hypothetical protein
MMNMNKKARYFVLIFFSFALGMLYLGQDTAQAARFGRSRSLNQTIVSVLFDAMLRENEDEFSKQVRELWHFSRDRDKPKDLWELEGIQQVAS